MKFKTYRELVVGATTPNAHCPVCGERVFFYESPHGGRVFFDELGPPWPKHPCTVVAQDSKFIKKVTIDYEKQVIALKKDLVDGWQPFLCEMVKQRHLAPDVWMIEGTLDNDRKTFFVKSGPLSEVFPFFIKQSGAQWLISTICSDSTTVEPLTLSAYVFESELHDLMLSKPNDLSLLVKQVSSGPDFNRMPTQIERDERPQVEALKNKLPKKSYEPSLKAELLRFSNQSLANFKPTNFGKDEKPRKKALKRKDQIQPNLPSRPVELDSRTSLEIAIEKAREKAANTALKSLKIGL